MEARARRALSLGAAALLLGCGAAGPGAPARTSADVAACAAEPERSGPELIARFYESFSRKDFPAMACCYHPDIEFTDSIFGTLKGRRALAMWAMLTSQPGDLRLQYSQVRVEGAEGHAHWDAQYTFPFLLFHNEVNNSIGATFELKDGKIFRHRDEFDLDRWMHMALWPLGGVVAQSTIRGAVQKKLDEYVEQHAEFQEPRPGGAPSPPR